jgi:hypothetical protein
MSAIETTGVLLIFLGVLYMFLKAVGKFKILEEGEFGSRAFTLKGGPGLMLVGLGVFLLIISAMSGTPASPTPSTTTAPTPTLPPTPPPHSIVGKWENVFDENWNFEFSGTGEFVERSEKGLFKGDYAVNGDKITLYYNTHPFGPNPGYATFSFTVSDFTLGLTYLSSDIFVVGTDEVEKPFKWVFPTETDEITADFLVGNWSYISSSWTTLVSFDRDGIFGFATKDLATEEIEVKVGTYQLEGSVLTLYYTDGMSESYQLTYVDESNVKVDDTVYTRYEG